LTYHQTHKRRQNIVCHVMYTYIYIHIYICVCVCVCMYIYVHIYFIWKLYSVFFYVFDDTQVDKAIQHSMFTLSCHWMNAQLMHQCWRHDNQHNDTQINDIQHNNKYKVTLSIMTLSIMAECCYAVSFMLSVTYAECRT
jgi:hypothetical protein